jgi:type I restriction enzyme S subunit
VWSVHLARSNTQDNLNAEQVANLPVPVLALRKQREIADFLDAETARIDALIEKKQRMISFLDERQQALVDESVRDHPTQPLKHAAAIVVSNVDKLSTQGQQPVRLCNYTDVYYRRRITGDLDFMEATATQEQIARFGLRAGYVLITKDSETADDIAVPAFVPSDLPGVVCGYHLAVLKPRAGRAEGSYLYWALRSQFVRQQFTVAATGVTRFGLRTDAIGAARIPLPELKTQLEVAEHLECEQAHVDQLTDALKRQIALLRERRQALITAAVSGRLGRGDGESTDSKEGRP